MNPSSHFTRSQSLRKIGGELCREEFRTLSSEAAILANPALFASEKLLKLDWIESELNSIFAALYVDEPREEVSGEFFAELSDEPSDGNPTGGPNLLRASK